MTGPEIPPAEDLEPMGDPFAVPGSFGDGWRPMVSLPWRDDIPRGALSREIALIAAATALAVVNRVDGPVTIALAPNPTSSTAFNFYNDGFRRTSATSVTWTMTGQEDIPPGETRRYLLLLGAGGDSQVLYVANRPGGDWTYIPNGPEALIRALNAGSLMSVGFTAIATMEIRNNTANPYTPGQAFPASPFLAFITIGFPSNMLFNDTDVGRPVVPFGR